MPGLSPQTGMSKAKIIWQAADIERALKRMAHEIVERHGKKHVPALIGIHTCGEYLAQRLSALITDLTQQKPLYGVLDINLYRDDLTRVGEQPIIKETIIDFEIDEKAVVLVDDVLYTGRTARSALDALTDFGRPKMIQLAVLVDRGHRELPIKADYVGKNLPTSENEIVHVHLTERDPKDEVIVESRERAHGRK